MGRIVLCADTESLVRPMLIGLEGSNLETCEWLVSISDAVEAREFVANNHEVDEVWAVSTDDLVGINLAAAMRKDRPDLPIFLVAFEATGSDMSRAAQAGITAILSAPEFCERFDTEQRRRALMGEIADIDVDSMLDEGEMASRTTEKTGGSAQQADAKAASTTNAGAIDAKAAPAGTTSAGAAPASASATGATPTRATNAAASAPSSTATPTNTAQANAAQANIAPAIAATPIAHRDGNAFTISFLSGSGGVGKSTIAALASYRAAQRGFRTVVVDCDMQFGDLHQIMGGASSVSIDDVLAEPDIIALLEEETAANSPALVTAPSRLERSEDLANHLDELLGICASAFEIVMVNTGASWAESHAQLLERSAASVFLIDQRASSVHACQHALDLCVRLGIASAPFVFALNRCKRGALFNSIDIANVLQGAHVFEIKDGGSEVEEMLGAGLAADLAQTRNDLCTSIDLMLDDLLPSGNIGGNQRRIKGKATSTQVQRRAKSRRAGTGSAANSASTSAMGRRSTGRASADRASANAMSMASGVASTNSRTKARR